MEQEHLHDPLRFQYESNPRRFSARTKVIAILLVLIFMAIPLYKISPETFALNHIYVYVSSSLYSCFGSIF